MKIRWDELTRAQKRRYESKYRRVKRQQRRQGTRQSKAVDSARMNAAIDRRTIERKAEQQTRLAAIACNRHAPTAFMARYVPVKGCGCWDCQRLRVLGWEDRRPMPEHRDIGPHRQAAGAV